MKQKKQQETVNEQQETEQQETSLAVRDSQEIETRQDSGFSQGLDFAQALAELDTEIQQSLKAISVDKLTSRTSLLGKLLTLNDCFVMDFNFGRGLESNIVYVVTDESGELYFTNQTVSEHCVKYVKPFDKLRELNSLAKVVNPEHKDKQLALTNVRFTELTRGGVGNNKPIILEFTKNTKQVIR